MTRVGDDGGVTGAPIETQPGTVSRLAALDVTRTAAILGMIAVHVGGQNIYLPTGPWRALHLAAGVSAGTFAVAAGVALSLTNPPGTHGWRAWSPTVMRGAVLFLLGLLVEAMSGGVLVILCVYGALFVVAAPLRALSGRALMVLGAVLAVLWPIVSLLIRRQLSTTPRLEVSWDLFELPESGQVLLRTLFLDGAYPVPTWLALALTAWGAHRAGLLGPQRRAVMAGISAALLATGFGGAALVEAIWQPREQLVAALVDGGTAPAGASVAADHAFGVPASEIWPSLLTAGHHSGTAFELLQILGVAAAVYTLATYLALAVPAAAQVLSWPGRIALSIYVGHLALLWLTDWFWLRRAPGETVQDTAMPAFWALLVFWALAFAVGGLLQFNRGPLEALVRWVSHLPVRPPSPAKPPGGHIFE